MTRQSRRRSDWLSYLFSVLAAMIAAMTTTAAAQDRPQSSGLYGVDNEGTLKWYRPDAHGQITSPPRDVATGWGGFKHIFSGGNDIVYAVTGDGVLKWHKLDAVRGLIRETKDVSGGWEQYQQVFSGGRGLIYAMKPDGKLYWFRHGGYLDGRDALEGPKEVGSEWTQFKRIIPGGNGIVYVVAQDNRLLWLRHIEYDRGAKAWEGPKDVGGPGWGTYRQVFSTGGGVLYAVTEDGKLLLQRNIDYTHGVRDWRGPAEIAGAAWSDLSFLFAPLVETPDGGTLSPPSDATHANDSGRPGSETVKEFGSLGALTPSDEIRCRGYSRPQGSEYVFFTINSRPSPTGETIVTYEMAFTPGFRAAGTKGEGLQPGECAWVDRPIDQKGPFRIRFETVANAQLKQKQHGTPVDTSPTAAESYPDVNSIPRYLKVETHYWSFGGVSDTGRGYFRATGNGYWKPSITKQDVIRIVPR